MERNEIKTILSENNIECKICNKEISLVIDRKDQSISFKSHLKQTHNISINEYFDLHSPHLCKFCKTEPVGVKIVKNKDGNIIIEDAELCNVKSCVDERKKLNTNSVEYISIVYNVNSDEALKILHSRNKSPFYKSNFTSDIEYQLSQRKFSPRCPEYYIDKINPKTESLYTDQEIEKEITGLQCRFGKRNTNENCKDRNVFRSNAEGFIEKYGEQEGLLRHQEYKLKGVENRSQSPNFKLIPYSLKWYQYLYGDNDGKIAHDHRLKYKRFIETDKYYKMIFGEKWIDVYDEKINSKYRNFTPLSSKIADCFFANLLSRIDFININDIWCSFNKKERCIYHAKKRYFYDFTVISNSNKKIIEFNGDYWHANPIKYNENDYVNAVRVGDIWKEYEKKVNIAKEYGYEVLVIWENEIQSPVGLETNIERCLSFLKEA